MNVGWFLPWCTSVAWIAASSAQSPQHETYLLTDLGTLGGTSSVARSLNYLGLVAGWAQTATGQVHAVVLSNNVLRSLGTLSGSNSAALDISHAGHVVGWSNPVDSQEQRAFSAVNGVMTDLGALLPTSTNSIAHGVNSFGTVVGEFQTASGRRRPFIFANGILPLEFEGAATCVNDAGQIGGFEIRGGETLGFIISGIDRQYVGSLGSNRTAVTRINTNGVAVGHSTTAQGEPHAFAYENGRMHDLGTLGGTNSAAFGINSAGHVVGQSGDTAGGPRAFLYRKGRMEDLNDFLPPNSEWFLTVAYGINDTGQIVGAGQHQGQTRGFLLTPNFLELALYPGLSITGKIGRSYRIDYRDAISPTNSWLTLTNVLLPSSPYFFVDPRPVLFANRIYRSVLLPETSP